jgi:hypothetical protein
MTGWLVAILGVGGIWIALWFLRVRAWGAGSLNRECATAPPWSVCCIVPARNEEASISQYLRSLRGQGGKSMPIVVVDDESTDGTAACALSARDLDPRIQLLRGAPRPEGWSGKPWALTQGVKSTTEEWLVFCDADTVLDPDTFRMAAATIHRENLDCLSIIPQMTATRISVALLLACVALSRAVLFRPAKPGQRGMVQGAFLAIRRSALERVGGFDRLKASLLEDVEMGVTLQEAGFRVRTVPASPLISTAMYPSFAETWQGLCKHIYPLMGYSAARIVLTATVCVALGIFPVLSLVAATGLLVATPMAMGGITMLLASVATTGVMYGVMASVMSREALPPVATLLTPLAALLFGMVTVHSVYAYTWGHVHWKDRQYAQGHKEQRV